jgi:hypothetical protein
VKNREAYAGEIFRTKKFYPYTAELRDMDYTKNLNLNGTECVQVSSVDGRIFPDAKIVFYKDTFTHFDKSEAEGSWGGAYKILSTGIILYNWTAFGYGFAREGIAIIQNGKMVVSPSYASMYARQRYIIIRKNQ